MNKKVTKYLSGNVILREEGEMGPLVLGDCNSAVDFSVLKPNKVKTIVSIGLQSLPNKQKIPEDITHKFYDIHDNKQQKLPVQLLDEVFAVIEEGRKRGGVLVHCYAGVSRSSSFVIAYVMNKYNMKYDDAKEKVKKHRACIHPGDGFVRQLQFYGKVLQKRQEDRLTSLKKEEVVQSEPEPVKVQMQSQSVVFAERVKRGVKGAVKSAEGISPQKLRSSLMSSVSNAKIEQKQQKSEQGQKSVQGREKLQKVEKLPPIHKQKADIPSSQPSTRYQRTSSRVEIKKSIDKIEGKLPIAPPVPSIKSIYGNRTKVM